jgi:thiol-disulfide isomerase/thioredoxin
MNSFNLFRLDEGNVAREPKYISETEFQFIYDCIQGRYSSITSNDDKEKLYRKILKYLDVETIFSEALEYGNCKQAKAYFEKLKKENPGKEKLVNVQLFCSDKIPKFMNIYIQKIFENIKEMKNDSLRKKFISVHLDVFIDFFTSREDVDTVSLTPKGLLYQELVEMYSQKYDKDGNVLISFEFDNSNKNYIFKIFKDYLGVNHKEQLKSKSYTPQNCTIVDSNIRKLLCALTHRRDTLESFKFERGLEHSNQFIPYKGNVSYQINTLVDLNSALHIEAIDNANSENTVKEVVYAAYANTIKIILASKDVKEVYNNCYEQNNVYSNCFDFNEDIKNKIKLIFTKSAFLQIEEHDKMAKGDVMVDNPVPLCSGNKSDVLVKGDILELKYFTIDDIISSKKGNTLHITRILEPDILKIYKNIKESGLLNDYGSDAKFFRNFLEEIIDVIIEATEKIVEADLEKIKKTFDNVKGIIIAGPKYIERDNWEIFINKGKTGQQGRGVAISVKLPSGFETKARDLRYIQSRNLFCFAN